MEKTDNIPYNSITIEQMQEEHIHKSVDLWTKEYQKMVTKGLPRNWLTAPTPITSYLKGHAKTGRGVVATNGGEVIGYMVYDIFPFHGAETAYIPITGHSAAEHGRAKTYQTMYRHLSDIWVKDKILDHIITFFSPDTLLKNELYHLGFGLYAVDAFRSNQPIHSEHSASIMKASIDDIEDIHRLGKESRAYSREAPYFLARHNEKRGYYEDFLENNDAAVFMAEVDGEKVGFMSIRKNNVDDIVTLANRNTARIDELGAYITDSRRGQGIGVELLKNVVDWCRERGIKSIHVDYESANLYATRFWPRYFTPAMYSVKRRIHPDIVK